MTYSGSSYNSNENNTQDVNLDSAPEVTQEQVTFGLADIGAGGIADIIETPPDQSCYGDNLANENWEFVDKYDYSYVNAIENPQFPLCPDENWNYPGGWDYTDYTPDTDYRGYTSNLVKKPRLVELGYPLYDQCPEKQMPGGRNILPAKGNAVITSEPVKYIWIHPWLESGEDGSAFAGMPFSVSAQFDTWQSGRSDTDPADDYFIYNGMYSFPGAKDSERWRDDYDACIPTALRWKTSKGDGKWIYKMSTSRGQEGLGYNDEKSVGLEYGCIGATGFVNSRLDTKLKTKSNSGVKFFYNMYRFDATVEQIGDKLSGLADLGESIDAGYSTMGAPESTFTPRPMWSLFTKIKEEKGYGTDEPDTTILGKFKELRKIVQAVKSATSGYDNDDGEGSPFDAVRMYERGILDFLRNKKLTFSIANVTAIQVVCELMSEHHPYNEGVPEDKKFWIGSDTFCERLEELGEVTHLQFIEWLLTRMMMYNNERHEQIGFDFDLETVAKVKLGLLPEHMGDAFRFVFELTDDEYFNLSDFFYNDEGELCARSSNGFELSLSEFVEGPWGWCKACYRQGGYTRNLGNIEDELIHCYRVNNDIDSDEDQEHEEIIATTIGEDIIFEDVYDDEPEYTARQENSVPTGTYEVKDFIENSDLQEDWQENGIYNNTYTLTRAGDHSDKCIYLAPVGGNFMVPRQRENGYDDPNVLYQKWHNNLYGWNANSDKSLWPNSADTQIATYGPFDPHELDVPYHFVNHKDLDKLDPRQDYGYTFWFATNPYAPRGEWQANIYNMPYNASNNKKGQRGYSTRTPGIYAKLQSNGKPWPPGVKKELYFRVTFWQWKHKGGIGPKTSLMYDRGLMTDKGLNLKATVVVANGPKYNYEEEPPPKENKGPVYHCTGPNDIPKFSDEYWNKGLRYGLANDRDEIVVGDYYQFERVLPNKVGVEELLELECPALRLYQGTTLTALDPPTLNMEENYQPGPVLRKQEGAYRIVKAEYPYFLFGGFNSSGRTMNQWSKDGEPWVKITPLGARDKKLQFGPGYWSDNTDTPQDNLYNEWFQTPLTTFDTSYPQFSGNTNIGAGRKYKLTANSGLGSGNKSDYKTKYEYDILFAMSDEALDCETYPDVKNQDNFKNIGRLKKDDYDKGFVFVAPSEHLIFGAHKTRRKLDSWNVKGERVQIKIEEIEGPNDNLEGPGYAAFGTATGTNINNPTANGTKYGNYGVPNFENNYWFNPIRHFNQFQPNDGVKVERGEIYTFTPQPEMNYDYRLIWATRREDLYPGEKMPGTVNGHDFIVSDEIIRRGDEPREIRAEGDYLIFGAFAATSLNVPTPKLTDWSSKGEPVPILIEEKIFPRDEIGPAYWAGNYDNEPEDPQNHTYPTWDRYLTPLNNALDPNFVAENSLTFLEVGRRYKVYRVADTPDCDYKILWSKNDFLSMNDPADNQFVFSEETLTKTTDVATPTIVTAVSENWFCYAAYNTGSSEGEWSLNGEPAPFRWELDTNTSHLITGVQYWTDGGGAEEGRSSALKNSRWKDAEGRSRIYPTGPNVFVKDNTYRITVLDNDTNPDYEHKIWFGDKPNCLNTTVQSDFIGGPILKKGDTATITMPTNTLIFGSFKTGRGINTWNEQGEPLEIMVEEVFEDPKSTGCVYYADSERNNDAPPGEPVEDNSYYPGFGQVGNPAKDKYTRINPCGDYDNHPKIQAGRKYRITPSELQDTNTSYDPNQTDTPYKMRMWFTDYMGVDVDTTKYSKWTAGRMVPPNQKFVDFEAPESSLVFGAFDFNGKIEPRDLGNWSELGEPTNFKIEQLPRIPKGSVYHAENDRTRPKLSDPHWYHPINTMKLKGGKNFWFEKKASWTGAGEKLTMWFVKNDERGDYNHSSLSTTCRGNTKITTDNLHPEDLTNEAGDPVEVAFNHIFQKGETLTPDSEYPMLISVPDGFDRVIFGRSGDGRTMNQWGRDGEDISELLETPEEQEIDPNIFGPTYWGDGVGSKPEFNNKIFNNPLNYIATGTQPGLIISPGSRYRVKPIHRPADPNTGEPEFTGLENYKVDVYEFDRTKVNILDPRKNNISDFNKVATVQKADLLNGVEFTMGNCNALILSASVVRNRPNTSIKGWSPNGEPAEVEFEKIPQPVGPVYWGENSGSTGPGPDKDKDSWGKGFPNFANTHWVYPLNAEVKTKGITYEVKIIDELPGDIYFWWTDNPRALQGGAFKDDFTTIPGTELIKLGTTNQKGKSFKIYSMGKYLVYGVNNLSVHETLDQYPRTGRPSPFSWKKVRQREGPAFPAEYKKGTTWHTDWDGSHNNYPKSDPRSDFYKHPFKPLKPGGLLSTGGGFKVGADYQFKRKAGRMDYDYNTLWTNTKDPKKDSDFLSGVQVAWTDNFPVGEKGGNKFTSRAKGKYLYFAMTKKNAPGDNKRLIDKWEDYLEYSQYGEPAPFSCKKDIDFPKPPSAALWALLALLLALLGTFLYFMAVAPWDFLVEMNMEGPWNRYPIRRKEVTINPETEMEQYNYPNEKFINWDKEKLHNDNGPYYFNYYADSLVRVFIKLCMLRHNGYLFHMSNNSSSSSYEHWFEFMKVTPSYGMGYVRTHNPNFKKFLRDYNQNAKEWDVNVFTRYRRDGVKAVRIDCQNDPLKQNLFWNDTDQWFDPINVHCHHANTNDTVKTLGSVTYRNAFTMDNSSRKSKVWVKRNGATPTQGYVHNIFNDEGFGWLITGSHSNYKNSNGYSVEIHRGDHSRGVWPELPGVHPAHTDGLIGWAGLEFDLVFHDPDGSGKSSAADWQINYMHLNYMEIDYESGLYPTFMKDGKRASRSLLPTSDTQYQFRNSANYDSPNTKMGQLTASKKKIHMKVWAKDPIPDNMAWTSISMQVWRGKGGSGTQAVVIANLRPLYSREGPEGPPPEFPPDEPDRPGLLP